MVARILDWFRKPKPPTHVICPICEVIIREGDRSQPWEYQTCPDCLAWWKEK